MCNYFIIFVRPADNSRTMNFTIYRAHSLHTSETTSLRCTTLCHMLHKESISRISATALTYLLHRCVACDFGRSRGITLYPPYSRSREIPPRRASNFRTLTDFPISVTARRSLPFRITKTCGYSDLDFSSLAFGDRYEDTESGISLNARDISV